jgi:hypothetical protein
MNGYEICRVILCARVFNRIDMGRKVVGRFDDRKTVLGSEETRKCFA